MFFDLLIRGGIVMSLFGPSPRYATKELEFAEVYPASSPNQTPKASPCRTHASTPYRLMPKSWIAK